VTSTRTFGRFSVLFLASYGPLAPVMLLFLVAMPPLIAVSGWPWWIDVALVVGECGLIVVAALWLGPEAVAAVREFMKEERQR
jgi:hypothetical protein